MVGRRNGFGSSQPLFIPRLNMTTRAKLIKTVGSYLAWQHCSIETAMEIVETRDRSGDFRRFINDAEMNHHRYQRLLRDIWRESDKNRRPAGKAQ